MARYALTSPAFVRNPDGESTHVAAGATLANPIVVEFPDDYPPSEKWIPLDEAARKAQVNIGLKKVDGGIDPAIDPVKEKARYDREASKFLKRFDKEIPEVAKPKQQIKEISTNAEAAEAQGKKVVGRNADKSPV